jgi:hypothetical protein
MKTRTMTHMTVCGAALALALTMASAEAGTARRTTAGARGADLSTASIAPPRYTLVDPIRYPVERRERLSTGLRASLWEVTLAVLAAPLR